MVLSLKVEVMAGTTIESAVSEMETLANRIGIMIEADFNDVRLMMPPNGDAETLEEGYYAAIKSTSQYKIATGYPRVAKAGGA